MVLRLLVPPVHVVKAFTTQSKHKPATVVTREGGENKTSFDSGVNSNSSDNLTKVKIQFRDSNTVNSSRFKVDSMWNSSRVRIKKSKKSVDWNSSSGLNVDFFKGSN